MKTETNPLKLTEKDFEILQECIDAWIASPGLTNSLTALGLVVLTPPHMREKMKAEEAIHRSKAKDAEKSRRALSIMLRAKIEAARAAAQEEAIEQA